MHKLVECVPNFSEGRDPAIIEQIADAIQSAPDAFILHIDSGYDANRTVITFVAAVNSVVEAAFRGIQKAAELIDMRRHHGVHPRFGATDVCPLIPLDGVSDKECIDLCNLLAQRVGNDLGIPVYLYAKSAQHPDRIRLPDIRRGEYEALEDKLKTNHFVPDYGPQIFNAKSGATVIGARDFLLAYNINLNTTDVTIANKIAEVIRESGHIRRDSAGVIIRDAAGQVQRHAGKLKFVQAKGWYMPHYGCAQVTTNVHNFRETGLHTVYELVKKEAKEHDVSVTGSELIGLAPQQALLDAGQFYWQGTGLPTKENLITAAISGLGLNSIRPFQPQDRILEYALKILEKNGFKKSIFQSR